MYEIGLFFPINDGRSSCALISFSRLFGAIKYKLHGPMDSDNHEAEEYQNK